MSERIGNPQQQEQYGDSSTLSTLSSSTLSKSSNQRQNQYHACHGHCHIRTQQRPWWVWMGWTWIPLLCVGSLVGASFQEFERIPENSRYNVESKESIHFENLFVTSDDGQWSVGNDLFYGRDHDNDDHDDNHSNEGGLTVTNVETGTDQYVSKNDPHFGRAFSLS